MGRYGDFDFHPKDLHQKLEHIEKRITELNGQLAKIETEGDIALTAPDSKKAPMPNGGYDVCCNVQTAVVPKPIHPSKTQAVQFAKEYFQYDLESDTYTCPQGAVLHHSKRRTASKTLEERYVNRFCGGEGHSADGAWAHSIPLFFYVLYPVWGQQ